MKLSWNSIKVSIAGAKLSHLVQKDKIWDHGTMIEQVKMIFFKVQRAKNAGEIADLKKHLTIVSFEKVEKEMKDLEKKGKMWVIKNPVIKEVAIIEVHPAKNNKPDNFIALLKGKGIFFIADKNKSNGLIDHSDHIHDFSIKWDFIRQGDWWLLNN